MDSGNAISSKAATNTRQTASGKVTSGEAASSIVASWKVEKRQPSSLQTVMASDDAANRKTASSNATRWQIVAVNCQKVSGQWQAASGRSYLVHRNHSISKR